MKKKIFISYFLANVNERDYFCIAYSENYMNLWSLRRLIDVVIY